MDWPTVVQEALQLDTYTTEDDIKDLLRWRFRHGNRVDGNPEEWYRYLVRQDELTKRNRLIEQWSTLWRTSDVELEPITYEAPLEELERRIQDEMDRRKRKAGN